MKKMFFLFFIITISFFCSPKSEQVEKYIEDGVEVVMNHVEPYKMKGESSSLALEIEFSIDFARDDIGELGIAASVDFEVDSEGNLYFFYADKEGNLIFKFDPQGNYLNSFGTKGQGPGEMQWIVWTGIDNQD